jgi:membrane fusion protein (multidrug efflux system)
MLLPYLTDSLGIAALAAGLIVLLPKAWDVVLNPIAGRISRAAITAGNLVQAGPPSATLLTTIVSLDPIYVNFGVPQQAISQLRRGRTVRIVADDPGGIELNGSITAIDSVVDESTRNVQAQVTLANPRGTLRPGMFVQTAVAVGAASSVVALPASAISYAPFGDSVFVVTDLKDPSGKSYRGVRQQFVKLGGARGDQIAVTSGIKAGDEVVTSGVFKLRNGAAVLVNNKVRPGNNPSPKPENS